MLHFCIGQAIYDLLNLERQNGERIRNIVVLGVNTFKWSFAVRKKEPPGQLPFLQLTAPSGDVWEFGDSTNPSVIRGTAADFCVCLQISICMLVAADHDGHVGNVVTQTRNVLDTKLKVQGEPATEWMWHAQCFAGPSEPAPAPGARQRTMWPKASL